MGGLRPLRTRCSRVAGHPRAFELQTYVGINTASGHLMARFPHVLCTLHVCVQLPVRAVGSVNLHTHFRRYHHTASQAASGLARLPAGRPTSWPAKHIASIYSRTHECIRNTLRQIASYMQWARWPPIHNLGLPWLLQV